MTSRLYYIAICTRHMMFGCFRDRGCRSSVNRDSHMFEIIRCTLKLKFRKYPPIHTNNSRSNGIISNQKVLNRSSGFLVIN